MNLINKYIGRLLELKCYGLLLSLAGNSLFLHKFIAPMQRMFYLLDLKKYKLEPESSLNNPLRVIQYSTRVSHTILQAILDFKAKDSKSQVVQSKGTLLESEEDILRDSKHEYCDDLLAFIEDCFEMSIHQLELILERFGEEFFDDAVRVGNGRAMIRCCTRWGSTLPG